MAYNKVLEALGFKSMKKNWADSHWVAGYRRPHEVLRVRDDGHWEHVKESPYPGKMLGMGDDAISLENHLTNL